LPLALHLGVFAPLRENLFSFGLRLGANNRFPTSA